MKLLKYFKNSRGFSLAELAIALTIVGILASFSLGIGNVYQSNAQLTKTKAKIQLIASALAAYVGTNDALPCPAIIKYTPTTTNFGKADTATGCTNTTLLSSGTIAVGMVPFEDLNLQADMVIDEWGDKIVYAVTTNLTNSSTFISAAGSINIEDGLKNPISSTAAYFLFSPGQNLNGAFPRDSTVVVKTCSNSYLDYANCEFELSNTINTFMDAATHDTSFDDIVNWTTKSMIGSGLSGTLDSRIGSLSPYNICVVNSGGTQIDCANYKNKIYDTSGNLALGLNTLYNNTGTSNLGIGSSSLNTNTSGNYNLGIGSYAASANTTGNDNIGIGYYAISSNTTGSDNVGIGYYALNGTSSTTPLGKGGGSTPAAFSSNVGIGSYALYSNSSGDYNIAIGSDSIYSNTGGTDNIGIGYQTLYNTTSSQNIAIGSSALYNNGGTDNIAIGYQTLYNSGVGSRDNIGIGYQALYNSSAADNIGIGYQALYNTTSGANNVAIGQNALLANVDGTQNVAIGSNALSLLPSGFNSIAIGANALMNNTTSNNIGIGGAAFLNMTSGQFNIGLDPGNTTDTITTGSHNVILTTVGWIAQPNMSINGNVLIGSYLTNNYNNTVLLGNWLTAAHDGDVLIGDAQSTYAYFTNGSTGWTFGSDKRLKTDIKPISYGLDAVMALKPVSFKFKNNQTNKRTYGFIAQDVKEVAPEAVLEGTEKEHYLRIDYDALIPILTQAIQDLEKQVQALQAEVNELKQKKK